ncbi:MAG: sigma-70 family RNA polymerase sigma factor [Deltaproteobacteria bacterium]|nr:sigma-70 family RNA polymerase sigma factor [Deltaproteobacteria bacterium]
MSDPVTTLDGEDSSWLRAVARNRDAIAHRALFDRYFARVYVFIERRVDDRELARELTSDVFLEVWEQASRFRGDAKVSTWIFGIARFKSLEAVRGQRRFKRSRVLSGGDELLSRVPESRSSATQLGARETLRRVAEAMDRLPRDQREALLLAVVEGLEPEEIASRQQISRDTVKTRVSRARRALRRMLGGGEALR